ncbi:MAG TPA: GGDEF domain-containing protein [Chloroflexi bacterium]|nr:GGDEF domain-containing protein [Chloroflexota bacterium]HBY07601.1 GGDEF domain-containing protein [Chloroflexota bacterium]
MTQKIVQYLGSLDKKFLTFYSVVLVVLLGIIDYLSGFELAFSLFYLLPVSISAWFVGRKSALLISVLSTVSWFISDNLAGAVYSHSVIGLWNALVRLGFFVIVAFLLTNLNLAIEQERILSRTDFLTGITNSRYFYELAFLELYRAKRYNHPITIAYLDLDNFKQVNDRFGHSAGDALLKVFAQTLRTNFRQTDIIARMGGDEFVVLLPETDANAAKAAVTKAQVSLLEMMQHNNWNVTVSIGVITFEVMPDSLDEALRQVDELMYSVKFSGKNNIRFVSAD